MMDRAKAGLKGGELKIKPETNSVGHGLVLQTRQL